MIVNDTAGRIGRSVIQLIAGGGITTLVGLLANGLGPVAAAAVLAVSALAVITCQNLLEDAGKIPAVLKPRPAGVLVDKAGTVIGGVVGAAATEVNAVAGTIIDDVGDIVGGIGPLENDESPDAP